MWTTPHTRIESALVVIESAELLPSRPDYCTVDPDY
jgi:hypothetical protein